MISSQLLYLNNRSLRHGMYDNNIKNRLNNLLPTLKKHIPAKTVNTTNKNILWFNPMNNSIMILVSDGN